MPDDLRLLDPRSGATARIAPQLGFNCYSFQPILHGKPREVLDSPADVLTGGHRPSSFGTPLLFPFPNRIRDGRFSWNGADYQLPLPPGKPNAIHGFCLDRPWRILERTTSSVTGEFQLSRDDPDRAHCWPADFVIQVNYRLAGNRLESRFQITNPGAADLPWGLGTHAYFRLPLHAAGQPENCLFQAPLREQWELADYLPTGQRIPLAELDPLRTGVRFGSATYDSAFTGWDAEGDGLSAMIFDEVGGIELRQSCDAAYFRDCVVFTPPGRNAVCLEPYTCVTDAINLQSRGIDAGLRVLPPGGTVRTWITLEAGPIVV